MHRMGMRTPQSLLLDNLVQKSLLPLKMTQTSALLIVLAAFICVQCQDTNVIDIHNSGSTNTAGYDIKIERNGRTSYQVFRRRPQIGEDQSGNKDNGNTTLTSGLTENLFQQIEKTMPFNQYPVKHCIKSVSFGYSLVVKYNGETTRSCSNIL
ncbi:unnamed protein product [Didymodactylos carnosus]|uniref:Uncharacterized protein n=1 Tax=Didymodactylos carnosus TaxID=1234261 RepID=A0A8S2N3R8_9BILA|nr:unnamed protein product [Didymodactylos carnosus]CAF3978930.1 unnamed protein product [Didymodactylos carnosus]